MSEGQEVKVNYLITAIDKATKTVEDIEKSMGSLQKSVTDTNKLLLTLTDSQISSTKAAINANNNFTKSTEIAIKKQTSFLQKLKNVRDFILTLVDAVANFTQIVANFDFQKIAKFFVLLSIFLKMRGFDRVANFFRTMAVEMAKFAVYAQAIDVLSYNVNELIKSFLSFRGVLRALGLEKFFDTIVGVTAKIVGLTAVFLGLSSSMYVVNQISMALLTLNVNVIKLANPISKLSKSFPVLGNMAMKSLAFVNNAIAGVGTAFVSTNNKMRATKDAISSVGKSFWNALKVTEIYEKGIFGLVTRLGALAGIFSLLGLNMIRSDSIMVKMAGGTLIGLTLAFGGLAIVLRQMMTIFGNVIVAVGSSLVNSMQNAVTEMAVLQDTTASFAFVVDSLNKSTEGATGSFEEWNKIVNEFSKTQRFSVEVTQRSVSELLRFGDSIGLTKKQMEDLLPTISQLAKANHKDLFQSTIAVVEALNGQTVMLQNMGVNLTQHAIESSKAGKAVKGHMKSMSNGQKVQLRYNTLMEKTAVLNGIVASTASTIKQQLERQRVTMQNINIALGVGAELIEQKVNVAWTSFIEIVEGFSKPALATIGFMTALTGRALQAVGTFTRWSFTIVLVVSSIKALNVVLKNNYIQNFIGQVAQSTILTKKLAAVFPVLSKAASAALTKLSLTGLGVNSVLGLTSGAMIAVAKAAWIMILPFVVILAKILLVVAALYVLYRALVVLNDKTKIFTNVWKQMLVWWEKSSAVIIVVKNAVISLAAGFKKGLLLAINVTALAIVQFALTAVETANNARIAWSHFKDDLGNLYSWMTKVAGKFSLISTAEAAEIQKTIITGKEKEFDITVKNLEQIKALKKLRESLLKDLKDTWNNESIITTEIDNQMKKKLALLGIQRDYVKELKTVKDAEAEIAAQSKARFALKVRETGAKAGLPGQMSEDIYAGVAAGSAGQVKGAVTSGLMNSGNPMAMGVGAIIDIFGKDQEEFKKFATELANMASELPIQIAENIPVLIDKLVKALPKVLKAFNKMMPILIDGIMAILADPKFWEAMVQVAMDAMMLTMGNPMFWIRIAGALIEAIVHGVPAMVNAFIAGIVTKLKEALGFLDIIANGFEGVKSFFSAFIEKLSILLVPFQAIASALRSVAKAIKKVLSGGGLFDWIPFEKGGVPDLSMAHMLRAQNGLASVPGNSTTGDNTIIRVNSKEMILTMEQQAKLFRKINELESGQKNQIIRNEVVVKIDEREIARTMYDAQVNGWVK